MPLRANDLALCREDKLAKVHPMWAIRMGGTGCSQPPDCFYPHRICWSQGRNSSHYHPYYSLASNYIILDILLGSLTFIMVSFLFVFFVFFTSACCSYSSVSLNLVHGNMVNAAPFLSIPLSIPPSAHGSDWVSPCPNSSKLNEEKALIYSRNNLMFCENWSKRGETSKRRVPPKLLKHSEKQQTGGQQKNPSPDDAFCS